MECEIVDEDNVPQELYDAFTNDKTIQLLTTIGWVDIDEPDFRCGNTYRVKINETN